MKSMGTGIIYKILLYPAWICMVLTVLMQTPAVQAAEGESSPERADLFRQVQALQKRVEQIRWEMGRPAAPPLHLTVKGTTIQNVYALTEVLYTKTGRLTFELTRQNVPLPKRGVRGDAAAVKNLLERSTGHIHEVCERLEIEPLSQAESSPGDSLDALLLEILKTNRQLNLLLGTQFAPRDVFQEVTVGMNYTATCLSLFPGVRRIPDEPEFVRGKQPRDVYVLLLSCLETVGTLLKQVKLHGVEMEIKEGAFNLLPSDVYDLASLIRVELESLHREIGSLPQPASGYDPGNKFPSHVFQRASMLQAQLKTLVEQTTANPEWQQAAIP